MEFLERIDRDLFLFLNGLYIDWLDEFFWIISLVITWIPLYFFLAYLIIRKFKKQAVIVLIAAGVLIFATDQSSVLIKNTVQRYRPTHNFELRDKVHVVKNERGGQYGFVSSHAANMWGLAVFTGIALSLTRSRWMLLLIGWAIVVSYGRIYSGVHYPSDVVAGAILGILWAMIMLKVQEYLLSKYKTEEITVL